MSEYKFEKDPKTGKYVDYYAALGVDPTVSIKTIESTFRKISLKYHPDKNPGDHTAADKFKKLSNYKTVLTDTVSRAAYDRAVETQGERRQQQYDHHRPKHYETEFESRPSPQPDPSSKRRGGYTRSRSYHDSRHDNYYYDDDDSWYDRPGSYSDGDRCEEAWSGDEEEPYCAYNHQHPHSHSCSSSASSRSSSVESDYGKHQDCYCDHAKYPCDDYHQSYHHDTRHHAKESRSRSPRDYYKHRASDYSNRSHSHSHSQRESPVPFDCFKRVVLKYDTGDDRMDAKLREISREIGNIHSGAKDIEGPLEDVEDAVVDMVKMFGSPRSVNPSLRRTVILCHIELDLLRNIIQEVGEVYMDQIHDMKNWSCVGVDSKTVKDSLWRMQAMSDAFNDTGKIFRSIDHAGKMAGSDLHRKVKRAIKSFHEHCRSLLPVKVNASIIRVTEAERFKYAHGDGKTYSMQ